MKKTLYILFLLFSVICFGQQKGEIMVTWNSKSPISFGSYKLTVPRFNDANFQFDAYKKQLFFNLKVAVSSKIDENSLRITNVVYENIDESELGDLSIKAIPSQINAKAKNMQARNAYFAFISLSPIIKDANGFKKIKSFSYYISFNTTLKNSSTAVSRSNTVTNSVLATGEWRRFYVVKSGVYKLSKSFLKQMGFDVDAVNPKKIKIYGNGGRMIPLKNSEYYPIDLAENSIQVVGESDGIFNDSDYVLFYAEGVDQWNEDSQTTNNLYDSKSYYYVNMQGEDGKRISDLQQPSGNSDQTITEFDGYNYYEVDKVNIVKLGRRWFGEQFNIENEQDFNFNIPNIVTSKPVNLTVFTAASSFTRTSFEVKANNQSVGTILFSATGGATQADPEELSTSIPASENIKITLKI
jgi:hypothetical protein